MLRLTAVDFGLTRDVPTAAVALQTGKVGGAADESGQLLRLIAAVVLIIGAGTLVLGLTLQPKRTPRIRLE